MISLARRSPTARGSCLRAAGARHDAQGDLGQRETRALRSVDEVAAQRQLATPGVSRAVDGTDDRHRAGDKGADHALEQQVLVLPLFVGHAVAFLKVTAGAKRPLARTGHNDTAHPCRGGVDCFEKGEQVVAHLGIERVRDLGPVQGQ